MDKSAKSRANCYKLFSKAKAKDNRYGTDPESNQELFAQLMKADPTGGANCQWLLKQYRNNQIDLTKVDQIREDLAIFFEHNLTFPIKEQNLEAYNYEQIAEIASKIRNNIPLISGIYERDDVVVLINNNRFTVAVPLSYEASKLLGAGTKWCTTSKKDDDGFMSFLNYSPLYIINFRGKKNEKYQMSFVAGELKDMTDEDPSPEKYHELTTLDPILRNFFLSNEFRIPNSGIVKYAIHLDRRLSKDNDQQIVEFLFFRFSNFRRSNIFGDILFYEKHINDINDYISKYYTGNFSFLEEFVNLYMIPFIHGNNDNFLSRPNHHENHYIKDGIIYTGDECFPRGERYFEAPNESYINPKNPDDPSSSVVIIGTKPVFRSPRDFSREEIKALWNPENISPNKTLIILTNIYAFCKIELSSDVLVRFTEEIPIFSSFDALMSYVKNFPIETNRKILDIYFMNFLTTDKTDNYVLYLYLNLYHTLQATIPSEIYADIERKILTLSVVKSDRNDKVNSIEFFLKYYHPSRWQELEKNILSVLDINDHNHNNNSSITRSIKFSENYIMYVVYYSIFCYDILSPLLVERINASYTFDCHDDILYLLKYLEATKSSRSDIIMIIVHYYKWHSWNFSRNDKINTILFEYQRQHNYLILDLIGIACNGYPESYPPPLDNVLMKFYESIEGIDDSQCRIEKYLLQIIPTVSNLKVLLYTYCAYYLQRIPVTPLRVHELENMLHVVQTKIGKRLTFYFQLLINHFYKQSFDFVQMIPEEIFDFFRYHSNYYVPDAFARTFITSIPRHYLPFVDLFPRKCVNLSVSTFENLKSNFLFFLYAKVNLCKETLDENEINEIITTPEKAYIYLSHVIGNIPEQIERCGSVEKYLSETDSDLWKNYLSLVSQVLGNHTPTVSSTTKILPSSPQGSSLIKRRYGLFVGYINDIESNLAKFISRPFDVIYHLFDLWLNPPI